MIDERRNNVKIRKANIQHEGQVISNVYLYENKKEEYTLVSVPDIEWSTVITYDEDTPSLLERLGVSLKHRISEEAYSQLSKKDHTMGSRNVTSRAKGSASIINLGYLKNFLHVLHNEHDCIHNKGLSKVVLDLQKNIVHTRFVLIQRSSSLNPMQSGTALSVLSH